MGAIVTAQAQPAAQAGKSILQGHVRDSAGKGVADAAVFLEHTPEPSTTVTETETVRSDSAGAFKFSALHEGTYRLRAGGKPEGSARASVVSLGRGETKTVDLLWLATPSEGASASQVPEFFDEPQFTVAGVASATNSGGHGSDNVLRNSESLVKATIALGSESSDAPDSAETGKLKQDQARIQAQLLPDGKIPGDGKGGEDVHADAGRDEPRLQQADLHHQLAEIDEKLGDPLAAVHEYQRAAELAASETNLFDWASELLIHRALEPATEVFMQGKRLYPGSARMLIGLGVSWYARGSYERAAEAMGSASDLAPGDETPYLFMGRMQSEEAAPAREILERLARFQRLQPGNALANYYYAVGLWKSKQAAGSLDEAGSGQVETLLQKAIELDPKLAAAHLQLGVVYAQLGDSPRAIAAYEKAIKANPGMEEAHYRLALALRRTGDTVRAQKELEIHEKLAERSKEEAERERNEIPQFVIALRDK
jgi:tetratricopeptide (TPR) repeat protein